MVQFKELLSVTILGLFEVRDDRLVCLFPKVLGYLSQRPSPQGNARDLQFMVHAGRGHDVITAFFLKVKIEIIDNG